MDFKTVVTISALLLITAEVQTAVAEQGTNAQPKGNSSDAVNLSSAAPATDAVPISDPSSSSPVLFVLTVKWTSKCEGHLILHHPSSPSHVCHYSSTTIRSHLTNVCENKKGCKEPMDLKKGEEMPNGYNISEDRPEMTSCEALMVQCKAEPVEVQPDVQGQLQAYKVVTALLCCVLVVLLLIRFTRPTVKALQKRLSNRSQTRWVGPTQSHSVSHHRGKTCNNEDGEKRLSYPALERLAVSDSREPSSNRSSGYNF
ncbi:uncharacterized protein LOC133028234 isoform X1 [Limanda limanda]|uniref:uncharacterized protein LOC133028234 isoform X1 n=1 Tax=Limanda limanda TaxID=27771 RepID=UPI0029C65880|nr:uncharacterized protein LOC133028234 isoform X1 [Limanda limanda]